MSFVKNILAGAGALSLASAAICIIAADKVADALDEIRFKRALEDEYGGDDDFDDFDDCCDECDECDEYNECRRAVFPVKDAPADALDLMAAAGKAAQAELDRRKSAANGATGDEKAEPEAPAKPEGKKTAVTDKEPIKTDADAAKAK